jgi:putative membrane protein insertion efficiency factor
MTETDTGLVARGARAVVSGLIRAYQVLISPLFPRTCRFHPTCSTYALTSVERFGVLRGGWLAAKRIARCNPFNPGGFDPVPEELHLTRNTTGRPTVH